MKTTIKFPKCSRTFGPLAFVLVSMLMHPGRAFTKPELDEALRIWRDDGRGPITPQMAHEILKRAHNKERAALAALRRYEDKHRYAISYKHDKHVQLRNAYTNACDEHERLIGMLGGRRQPIHVSTDTFDMGFHGRRGNRSYVQGETGNGYFRFAGKCGRTNTYVLTARGRARAEEYAAKI